MLVILVYGEGLRFIGSHGHGDECMCMFTVITWHHLTAVGAVAEEPNKFLPWEPLSRIPPRRALKLILEESPLTGCPVEHCHVVMVDPSRGKGGEHA